MEEDSRAAARRLLARSVWEAWGWTQLPALAQGEQGKPFFPDFLQHHFNLSHTGGLCLCALSEAGPVGVDIERVRPRRPALPRYAMSEEEFSAFDGSWEDFYRIWTLKEAYCKYLGRSIFPPRAVPAPPPVPYRCFSGEGWRAALCADPGDVVQPAAERLSRRPYGPLPERILWVDIPGERGPY